MKNDMNLHYCSATDLVAALTNKEISSAELVEETISRIERCDQKINAVVVRDFERARVAAKNADVAIARNEFLPLLGLPITVKECFNIVDLTTTWGNTAYSNWYPSADALAITRLKNAGAIIIGKTNIPCMLQDWQSYNEIYGTTNNPWDLALTAGGSSGGSAAALAAGFTSLELGSDFAGSIRVPAHFCGVFGHKPSIHLVPMRGCAPPNVPLSPYPRNDLVVAGPMARTAVDLRLMLDIVAGPDDMWDAKGYKVSLPAARHNDLRKFRVLLINSHPLCPTAAVITEAMMRLASHLSKLGVTIAEESRQLPDLAEVTRTYVKLFSAFIAGNMSIEEYQAMEQAAKTLTDTDTSIADCILRGATMLHRNWDHTVRKRNQLRDQWRSLYQEFDVVVCPVMPTPAFPHDHSDAHQRQIKIDSKLFPYIVQYSWPSLATLFGLPATVVPIDHTKEGLPIGVQVIGDYLEDYTTIKFAELLARELGGFTVPNNNNLA